MEKKKDFLLIWIVKKYLILFITHGVITKIINKKIPAYAPGKYGTCTCIIIFTNERKHKSP